jgi:dipeptidyl aminopeptidase/acylaminoacyl peptidase
MTQKHCSSAAADRRPAAPRRRSRLAAALAIGLIAAIGCDEKSPLDVDRTPPEAGLDSPGFAADVSGVSFLVQVAATDDVGVTRVEYTIDDSDPVVDEASPWRLRVVTLGREEGASVPIRVEAFDAAGNSTRIETTVTVEARETVRLTSAAGDDRNPAWSPDGSRIAFQSDRDGGQFDVWVMDDDGGNAAALTTDLNEDRNPAWSPDGLWLAFDSDRGGNFDIWRISPDAATDDATAVTTGNNDDVEPAWTLDGIDLLFSSNRGTGVYHNLWMQPVAGNDADAVQVTAYDEQTRAPASGPTGDLVAFSSTLNFGAAHIYTKTLGETQVEPLTGDVGFTETDPDWLPDALVVVFTRSSGADSNLYIQAPGGESPQQITFGSGTIGDGGAAWSPDGERIAFHSDRGGDLDIWVLQ